MATFEELSDQIVKGKRKLAVASTNDLLGAGETPLDIINKGL